jgi:hypothetical protein
VGAAGWNSAPGNLSWLPMLRRLQQMHSLWRQALEGYFEPSRFRVAVQNCITTSRTVTFILQHHKAAVPNFDDWYVPYRNTFAADPIMSWAKTARNKIEKEGDLETLSQVRAELIAAYAFNPTTNWLPTSIVWTTEQIRRSIPPDLLDTHVVDNGALAIEGRWVDVELP